MDTEGKPVFLSNHAGGILGGISPGQPVVCRFAVKPTSSILTPRRTVDRYGAETEISTKGRHDPCVGIRAVPIGEAMVACVIADHYLRHRAQVGEGTAWPFEKAELSAVMLANAGIHVFLCHGQDVDGRDIAKRRRSSNGYAGHDETASSQL